MFKSWWNAIKEWILGKVEAALLKEIQKLDRYEVELADLIRKHIDPNEKAKALVDYIQGKLSGLIIKVFDSKWFSRSFFVHIEKELLDEVDELDKYEDDLASIIRKHLNADEKSKLVVDYVQNYLTALVKKYIQKI